MLLRAADVNTGGESSTSLDVNGAESSTAESVETQAEESTEAEAAESTVTEESATEEQAEETAEQQTETKVETQGEKKTEEAIPYERFSEVNNKKAELERELESAKPLVEQSRALNDFMAQNQISPQEFQSALKYLQALRSDPKAAYAMLKPTYEQLASLAGERLPQDLQAEVVAGTLAQERALEIAQARAQQTYQQWQQQQRQTGQFQSVQQAVTGTIQSWATTKQSVDPDFKPGTPLWEQVDLRLKSMPAFQSPQEAMSGSEKAYTEAKAFLGKLVPRTVAAVKPALKSRNGSSNNSMVMKTAEDVAKAISAGVRPSQMRYS